MHGNGGNPRCCELVLVCGDACRDPVPLCINRTNPSQGGGNVWPPVKDVDEEGSGSGKVCCQQIGFKPILLNKCRGTKIQIPMEKCINGNDDDSRKVTRRRSTVRRPPTKEVDGQNSAEPTSKGNECDDICKCHVKHPTIKVNTGKCSQCLVEGGYR